MMELSSDQFKAQITNLTLSIWQLRENTSFQVGKMVNLEFITTTKECATMKVKAIRAPSTKLKYHLTKSS